MFGQRREGCQKHNAQKRIILKAVVTTFVQTLHGVIIHLSEEVMLIELYIDQV